MQKITLPAGVTRVSADGKSYTAKAGDTVVVSDFQAAEIKKRTSDPGWKVPAVSGGTLGTRKGMRCPDCAWLGQAWATVCHRCTAPLVPEVS